jgi:hypothetical protein
MDSSEEKFFNYDITDNNSSKRPVLLTVICVLSFINNGWGVINNAIYSLFHSTITDTLSKTEFPKEWEMFSEIMLKMLSAGRLFFVVGLILSLSSVIGVYKMWHLRKQGFHIYSISQLIMLIYPILFLKDMPISAYSIAITGGFIAMYASQLKNMK